jgi:predicted dehydrogenase
MNDTVTFALVGAGQRGAGYARLVAGTGRARVVAVAEPWPTRRAAAAAEHEIAADLVMEDWRALAARPKLADAVLICTQDADHVEPAVAFAELGYDVLLEKPMATSEDDCRRIVDAVEKAGVIFGVCHVLRYTPYTRALRRELDTGRIGDIVSVEHLEPVGWWHQAHSYVRGNWRREDTSTFMLMSKSCHDIDWLAHVIGLPVRKVASFGGLYHFRPENKPAGASGRCLDCVVEQDCPYSAVKLYMPAVRDPARHHWPLSVITEEYTEEAVRTALADGPYGRCVYDCDNDVVDHQVVSLEYEGGVTASFTMTAFSPSMHRKTKIFGTHGYLEGDGDILRVQDFRTGEWDEIDTRATGDATAGGGHGGGDEGLIEAFVTAVAQRDPAEVLSGPAESLDSHRVVWAAERARRTSSVVTLDPIA